MLANEAAVKIEEAHKAKDMYRSTSQLSKSGKNIYISCRSGFGDEALAELRNRQMGNSLGVFLEMGRRMISSMKSTDRWGDVVVNIM